MPPAINDFRCFDVSTAFFQLYRELNKCGYSIRAIKTQVEGHQGSDDDD